MPKHTDRQLLYACQFALNSVPNTKLGTKNEEFPDTYALAAALGRYLHDTKGAS